MIRAFRSLVFFCVLTLLPVLLWGCVTKEAAREAHFKRVRFSDLPGWAGDDQAAALAVFQRSCTKLAAADPGKALGSYGHAADWQAVCAIAAITAPDAARAFFEAQFVPLQVGAGHKRKGLFTGYYEPELHGSRTRDARYNVPLLARPADLVSVDLGAFRPALKGQRIAGRVVDGKTLVPYADRAEINRQAQIPDTPLRRALVYTDDPVDAFFLQIQGSGRVVLDDGTTIRLNYDGQNGHPYTAIGRLLRERGVLEKGKAGMREIRAWLARHSDEAAQLMDENKSYVFFRESPIGDPSLGPPGAQGVPLTPGRSLAVDLTVHALGVPMFVTAAPPTPEAPALQRLMVAQDTGGAIVGPVRGDVFWGFGPAAAIMAGAMTSEGEMFVLVPPAVADQILAGRA